MGPGGTFEEDIFHRKNVKDYADPQEFKNSSSRPMSHIEIRQSRIDSHRNNALKPN